MHRFVAPLVALVAGFGCKSPDDPNADTGGSESEASSSDDASGSESATETATETGDPPACPGQTPAELMDCVDPARHLEDLEFVSDVRTPGSPHWQEVQDLCADRLTELGYEVTLQAYATGVNVVGVRPGTDLADEHVIVGAHYDHIPACSGADDNGSGVAATLELARILADIPTPRTLMITCWDEEELGLIGSAAQAQLALDDGLAITGVFSLDSIGYASDQPDSQTVPAGFDLLFPDEYAELEANQFRGDFLLWVSDDTMTEVGASLDGFADQLGLRTIGTALSDDLKLSPLLSDLRRSDHASFWDLDIPAMFFNDTGEFRYSAYHCGDGDDSVDKVNLEFAITVNRIAVATAAVALGM
ncbi:M28 family metallopeptidase [Nannocystaceae bacterium ST9]